MLKFFKAKQHLIKTFDLVFDYFSINPFVAIPFQSET